MNSRRFASRYASIEPWTSRWSCVRFENAATWKSIPASRSIASAADDTSITTCVQPAATILANVSCSTCGVGVVYGASKLVPPHRYETVPITPGVWPAAREDALDEVGRGGLAVRAGDADQRHALRRIAERVADQHAERDRAGRARRSARPLRDARPARARPRPPRRRARSRSSTNAWPSRAQARTATNTSPGFRPRASRLRTARTSTARVAQHARTGEASR